MENIQVETTGMSSYMTYRLLGSDNSTDIQ